MYRPYKVGIWNILIYIAIMINLQVKRWTTFKYQLLVFFIYYIRLFNCQEKQKASFFCKVDPSNDQGALINFGVIPKSDSIYRIYAFDATTSDTLDVNNRINDCFVENTVTDPNADRIEKDITVVFGANSHSCGISVTGTTVKKVDVLFRTQAYANLFTGDDVVYRFSCFSDNLSEEEIATSGHSGSEATEVELMEPNPGLVMRVRQHLTNIPLTNVQLGEDVYLSIEFLPGKDEGPDNYGIQFFVGILGNDAIAADSSELLYLVVIPRYNVRTYVTLTSAYLNISEMSENRDVLVFNLPTEIMGCSDNGIAVIANKGIEVTSTHEVAVQVCNSEADTEDCYTAFPLDVFDKDHFAAAKSAVNESSEVMVIATEDDTHVELILPSYTGLTVSLDGVTKSAGETLSFTLQKRETFHLAVVDEFTAESVVGFKIKADKPVGVISGNRKYLKDHMAEQITGVSKLGLNYVLTPADPADDDRTTTYIVLATTEETATVKRYLSSSTFETYTISTSTSPPLTIDILSGSPCELTSDKPIEVVQIVNEPTGIKGFESAMLILPSVQQWSPFYNLYAKDSPFLRVTFVFPDVQAATDLTLEFGGSSFGAGVQDSIVDVVGPSGYKFHSSLALQPNNLYTLSSTNAITQFQALAYTTNANKDTGRAFVLPGQRYPTIGECPSTVARQGDLLDNDCDNKTDEELLNLIDDDQDGKTDEDLVNAVEALANYVILRPHTCQASGRSDFLDVAYLQDLTLENGCVTTEEGPFKPNADFTVTDAAGDRKIYTSGVFQMFMFEEHSTVFFKCGINFCLKEDDATCIPICQPSHKRRKRAVSNETSISTYVKVVPKTPDPHSTTDGTKTQMDPITCLENTYFLVIFIVLIIVAVLSFSTALCICCLFRQRRDESKTRFSYRPHRKYF